MSDSLFLPSLVSIIKYPQRPYLGAKVRRDFWFSDFKLQELYRAEFW